MTTRRHNGLQLGAIASARRLGAVLGLVWLAWPAPALAQRTDVATLRNGDRITGEVKTLGGGRLEYKTDSADTVQIEWDWVVSLVSSNFFEVITSDGRRFYGALLEPTLPGSLRVGTEAAATDLRLGQVAQIERLRTTFWSRLKGSIDLGFSYTKADLKTELTIAGQVNYRTRRARSQVSIDTMFRKQEEREDVNRDNLAYLYTRFFTGRWLATAFAGYHRNTELALDGRVTVGTAGGYHIVHTVEQDLIFLIGAAAARETFSDEREQTNSVEALIAARYTLYALGGRDFTVTADATLYPSLSVQGRLRFEANLDFRKEIFKDFYISLRFFDSFDNSVEDPGAQNDFGITTSIGYSW